ncbi:tyrosine-type recombinase/integrase [Cellulomonas sp. A375-1]|uniref:tyrosine-type recombinase/integrase n=1 Tax=Cellulomonas sp. A375-1 TaxID=1672219 RepID=UPI0018CCBA45|nr:tyrosine-type recombinase/integrase [Cellulomonas sp. A375-1]
MKFSDPSEDVVRAWFRAGSAALERGLPLPDRQAYRVAPVTVPNEAMTSERWRMDGPSSGHSLEKVAEAWVTHKFATLRRGQYARRRDVERDLARHILPGLAALGCLTVESVTHEVAARFAAALATPTSRPALRRPMPKSWAGLTHVTFEQASEAGYSKSTIRRMRERGELPGYVSGRRVLVPVDELLAARKHAGPGRPAAGGLAKGTADDILGTLERVLAFAAASGVALTGTPMYQITGVRPGKRTPAPPRSTEVHSVDDVRLEAAQLHPIHQIALFLARFLGLRIAEVFGIRLENVYDLGHTGWVDIKEQGGRSFFESDGESARSVPHADWSKTSTSYRMLMLPRHVLNLVRTVIEVFHTDPETGIVDTSARLVPGLTRENEGGVAAFAAALKVAFDEAGLSGYAEERISPHGLRKSLATELELAEHVRRWPRHRWTGHAAGSTVHEQAYLRDQHLGSDKAVQMWAPLVASIEETITASFGDSLIVPTARVFNFAKTHPLKAREAQIHAALTERGWLLEPEDADGEPLLTTDQAAERLGHSAVVVRRRMSDGTYPATLVPLGHRRVWKMRLDDVERIAAHEAANPPLVAVADRLGVDYARLHGVLSRAGLIPAERVSGGAIYLDEGTVRWVEQWHARDRDVRAASMFKSEAAQALNVPLRAVERLLQSGSLAAHEDEPSRVTRASVEAYRRRRPRI